MSEPEIYVKTAEIKAAVQGQEETVLDRLGIDWKKGRPHIDCPYPSHAGKDDWRWDAKKAQALCTCVEKSDSIFNVVSKVEGLTFEDAKVRVCEIIGRQDLVKAKGDGKGQKTDPASLLSPPAALQAPDLPRAYLAFRLGVEPADVTMPVTRAVGWSALPYIEAPAKGSTKFNEVARPPCAVFETVAADGRRHAHRIYLAPAGQGKAALGETPDGRSRDPKKSASAPKDGPSTAGCSVVWGNPAKAERIVLAEGIETAAACAYAYRAEIAAGTVAVAAGIAANGVQAFTAYPTTRRITVAADRDEKPKVSRPEPTRAGEKAARGLGLNERERNGVEVSIALPGAPGTATDWLDVLRADGAEAVRAGVEAAARFVPTAAELQDRAERAGREAELERVTKLYPLPELDGAPLFYEFTGAGRVWLHREVTKGRGDAAVTIKTPIASPFGVTARLRVVDDANAYGLRLLLEDMDGSPRAVDIERKNLATLGGAEARGLFLEAGVRFQDDGEAVAVAALKAAHPEREIRIVRHPGWHEIDGARIYATPGGEVIGLPDGQLVELAAGVALTGTAARRGSLEGWKRAAWTAVAVPRCPHFTLGIVAGLAGVLVDLCGLDSCGVNLSGSTSKGKSTSQRLGASAWSATESGKALFQVAKTTANGFEALAARANGTVFALDEMAHLDGRETAKCIYALASGVGKARLNSNAALREPRHWRTYAMLSNETSLETKIKASGETWTGGMTVRVVDIDVDDVNAMVPSATMDEVEAISQHYGWAGPAFVRGLVAVGLHEKPDVVKDIINTFAERLAGKGADGATKRAAKPLAILLAAGAMAQQYGLLPPGSAVQEAVRWAWGKFTRSSEAVSLDPTALAVRNIRQWIAERWRTSLHGIHAEEKPTRDAVGWWDDGCVYLTPDRLVEAAGGALKEAAIASALSDAGMLGKNKGGRHLFVSWVPTVGKLKAYALSRDHFGRGPEAEPLEDDGFKVHTGGRA